MSLAEKRTARFLLAGACDSYVNCVCYVLSCVRWVETPLNTVPIVTDLQHATRFRHTVWWSIKSQLS